MRIVITGGGGFIGTMLARRLLQDCGSGDEIVLVDTLLRHGATSTVKEVLKSPNIRILRGDLTQPDLLESIPIPVDRVYHLAAIVGVGPVLSAPARVMECNTLTALHVFNWFAKNSSSDARLLFASSSEVYGGASLVGFPIPVPTPENVPTVIAKSNDPRFSYAVSKLWGEMYAKCLSFASRKLLASVRYHNVYGPNMGYDHVIPQVIRRVLSQENPFRMIGVQETRSFCWVEDAVEATCRLMESTSLEPGMVVHIGDQSGEIEIGRLYEMIFELCGWWPEHRVWESSIPGSVPRRCPDVAQLRLLTGYEPSTTLEYGLERTINWYRENQQ